MAEHHHDEKISQEIWYSINELDQIVAAGGGWYGFADVDDGQVASTWLRRSIWEAVLPQSLRNFYEIIYNHVRRTGQTVAIRYRCDSPTTQRILLMEVVLESQCTLRITNRCLHERPQPETGPQRDSFRPLLLLCSTCGRGSLMSQGGDWIDLADLFYQVPGLSLSDDQRVIRSLCSQCNAEMIRTSDLLRAETGRLLHRVQTCEGSLRMLSHKISLLRTEADRHIRK